MLAKEKQGLRRTQMLRHCTNWKENLPIYKLANASNKKDWSVQLVQLANQFTHCIFKAVPLPTQRWKKYLIFCQPDKKIKKILPHSRNVKWGLWIYICRNHIIIYINLDTFTTIMSIFVPPILSNWWIIHKLFQYFRNIFCQTLILGIFSVI